MTRSLFGYLLLVIIPMACRPSPLDAERRWEQALKSSLPPGWEVVAVMGNPQHNRFMCWLATPAEAEKPQYRVEVQINPTTMNTREWTVLIHPPVKRVPRQSVKFDVQDDGYGPLVLSQDHEAPEEVISEVQPLAEEAVRQVRALDLF
jgi:hypothetical protein